MSKSILAAPKGFQFQIQI